MEKIANSLMPSFIPPEPLRIVYHPCCIQVSIFDFFGGYITDYHRAYEGDTQSLDYSSCRAAVFHQVKGPLRQPCLRPAAIPWSNVVGFRVQGLGFRV